jgi:micrococcal nuclease
MIVAALVVAAAVVWVAGLHHRTSAAPVPPAPAGVLTANATVVRVIDGDTVELRVGGHRERVRLIGVNTPETVDPRKPVQCYGPEAKAFTHDLLAPGAAVHLERDVEPRDDYGRLLGYVYRADDGLFVNLELAWQGFAVPLTIQPNTAHATEFVAAAQAAERAGRGLWARCRT